VGGPGAGRAGVGRASVGNAPAGRELVPFGAARTPDVLDSADRSEAPPAEAKAHLRRKRRRRINIFIAAIAVFIMVAGAGLVYGTYYFDKVQLPEELYNPAQATKVYYSDGTTEMARLGDENRTNVKIEDLKRYISDVIVATEDNSFYTNDGVDYKGILRAAWNNVTGGERQGASTITQQYARRIAELSDMSYGRKIREAVLAVKLKKGYSNDQIMEMYLNTVPFGRQAYGVEAASKAFYNKSAKDLTVGEMMGLAATIKQPNSDEGPGPYDFAANPETAKSRFDWIKSRMVKLGFMSEADAAALQYPTMTPYDPNKLSAEWGKTNPTWLSVHNAMDELVNAKAADGSPLFGTYKTEDEKEALKNAVRNGGLKIVTTIDPGLQKIAQEVGSPTGVFFKNLNLKNVSKFPEADQTKPAYQDAIVAVEPGTGRVKAYYGGDDGSGTDYAGFYRDPVTTDGSFKISARPPGSTMKIYTAMAGLMAGYSIDSTWDAKLDKIDGTEIPITNAAKIDCQKGEHACMLWEAIRDSTNIPFASLTSAVGASKVREAARAAGIRVMEASVEGEGAIAVDLNNPEKVKQYGGEFGIQLGIGQYGITVLDHANGTATLAARGMAAEAHFVQSVLNKDGEKIYSEKIAPKQVEGFTPAMADDLCYAMQEVVKKSSLNLADGRQSAGKSGTWEYSKNGKQNGDAWFVGYTGADAGKKASGLAVAAWLGTRGSVSLPLEFSNGDDVYGAQGAGPLWREFMNRALKGTPKVSFRPKAGTGHRDVGTGKAPKPSTPPSPSKQPNLPNIPNVPSIPNGHSSSDTENNGGGRRD
jgi:membrane peptidoglycan carboxypeptidase